MTEQLRVCLVSAAYRPYPSGVSEHVHHLAAELQRQGNHVHVLTSSFPSRFCSGSSEPPAFPVDRIGRVMLIPMNRSYATLPVGLHLPSQVSDFFARHEFDIVHCHGLFWPEISYWAIRSSRAVNLFTILTAGFRITKSGSRLFRSLFRRHLSRLHGRIAISNRARAAVEAYVPGEYRIIPCGIDLNRFHTGLAPLPEHRKRGPQILFLGRLDARKGLDILLQAMPFVLRSRPDVRLVVVGSGPLEPAARRRINRLGIEPAVTLLGAVPWSDLPRYYAGSDVYCSPALGGEALGIVLLEAMAAGTPVVASRIPGYDETVRDGIDGLLCEPGNPEALSQSLLQVINNQELARRLSIAGQLRAQEYAWPLVARRTLDYYRELLTSVSLSG